MSFEKQFGVIFTNPKLPVLDYSTLDENIEIGSLVEVPLGSKVVIGIVWSAGALPPYTTVDRYFSTGDYSEYPE